MSDPNVEKPTDGSRKAKNLSRRNFMKTLALAGAGAAMPFSIRQAVAAGSPASQSSLSGPAAFLASNLLTTKPGERSPVFINYSNPREIRGMAAGGTYVWAAALNMVGRIDIRDNTFTTYDATLLPAYGPILHRPMAVDKDGALWIGTLNHGAYRFDTVKWTPFLPTLPTLGGQPLTHISAITIDKETGDLWFGSPYGLLKLDSSFNPIEYNSRITEGKPGFQSHEVLLELGPQDIENPPNGLPPGIETLAQVHPVTGLRTQHYVSGIIDDTTEHGHVWLSVGGLDFRRIWVERQSDGKLKLKGNPENKGLPIDKINDGVGSGRIPGGYVSDMIRDIKGDIWASTVYGAVRILNSNHPDPKTLPTNGGIDFKFSDPFFKDIYDTYVVVDSSFGAPGEVGKGGIFSMIKDKDQNLWFLSFKKQGLVKTNVPGVLKNRNDLTFYRPDVARLPHYPGEGAFNYGAVDINGNLWLASTEGVTKFIAPGEPSALSGRVGPDFEDPLEVFNSGQRSDEVNGVAVGREADLFSRLKWFATERGLYSFDGRNWVAVVPNLNITCVAVDNTNQVWFGSDLGVQYRKTDGTLSGWLPNTAKATTLAISQGEIWAGTENGLLKSSGAGFSSVGLNKPITAIGVKGNPNNSGPRLLFGAKDGTIYNDALQNIADVGQSVNAMAIDQNGQIYAGTKDGLFKPLLISMQITATTAISAVATGTEQLGRGTVKALALDVKGRLWAGTQELGVSVLDETGWTHIITGDGLVYLDINGFAFESNPYKANPQQYDELREDTVWIVTRHGISQFGIATPQTNYEPNGDRFIGFPLVKPTIDIPYVTAPPIQAKIRKGDQVAWFKITIDQRYSRILIDLDVPKGADYDLVVYPPAGKSSSDGAIFGQLEGLPGAGSNEQTPVNDPNIFHAKLPLADSSLITERDSILFFSANDGDQAESINSLLSGPPGDYQIGIVPYRDRVAAQPYTITVKVEPPFPKIAPFKASRDRLYADPTQPINDAVKAIALTHTGRLAGGSAVIGLLKSIEVKLGGAVEIYDFNIADGVQGSAIGDKFVYDAYNKWVGHEDNPAAANQVCEAIRSLIVERTAHCPNLQYVIIAGSDNVIPFYRVSESVTVGPEQKYPAERTLPAGSPLLAALSRGYHLSDSIYGALRDIKWKGSAIYISELSVGRLVETVDEIGKQIDAYVNGGPTIVTSALVTGYDFLMDQANTVEARLRAAKVPVVNLLNNNSWDVVKLEGQLIKNNQLVMLNGHFDHTQMQTANYYNQPDVAEKDFLFPALAFTDQGRYPNLKGNLFISVGCHSGLNVPGQADPTARDFTRILAERGALFIGNTGYGYGDSGVVIFSELVTKLVVDALTSGTSQVGSALTLAKQNYLKAAGPFGFGQYDIKALNICTLYGLPMHEIKLNQVAAPLNVQRQSEPAGVGAVKYNLPGQAPGDLKSSNIEFDLTNQWQLIETAEGNIFTLPDSLAHAVDGHPVLPKLVRPLSVEPGNYAHGALLVAAKYQDYSDFTPRITNPHADISLKTGLEEVLDRDFFASDGWTPEQMATINTQRFIDPKTSHAIGYKTGQTAPVHTLVVVPLQFRNPERARRYNYLKYEVYQSPRINRLAPVIAKVAAPRTGGQVNFEIQVIPRSLTFPLPEVVKVLVTFTYLDGDPNNRGWFTYPLKLDLADPRHERWINSDILPRPDGSRKGVFFIQALDSDGNVTCSSNKGLLETWVDKNQIGLPRTIRAKLQLVGDCSTKPDTARLFLQAVGDELGTGINRIYYRVTYLDGKIIEGSIQSSVGEVLIPAKKLSLIEYWAEDTLYRLEGSDGNGRRQIHIVTNGIGIGKGTLHRAILDAKEGDTILFRLRPEAGDPAQVRLERALPVIDKNGLTIDGLFPACDGDPTVEISAETALNAAFVVRARNVTIRGLAFSGFDKYIIFLDGEGPGTHPYNCLLEKNLLSRASDNGLANIILLGDCKGNILRANQVIRGNDNFGILIRGQKARHNKLVGNFIGTDPQGDDSLGQSYGVWLDQGAHHNLIGGPRRSDTNVIAGNQQGGVVITGAGTSENRIVNNRIGAGGPNGKVRVGNLVGVIIQKEASENTVENNTFFDNDNGLHILSKASRNRVINNLFYDNQEREIWIGQSKADAAQDNLVQSNNFKHVTLPLQLGDPAGTPPGQPNHWVQPPSKVSVQLVGDQLKLTANPGSTSPNALVELYLYKVVDVSYYDYTFLGSFQAKNDGSFDELVLAYAAKSGSKLALIATVGNNTSEFSKLLSVS